MSGDRSPRNVLAALLLVAALFVAMNLAVSAAPLLDWWLPLVLALVGAALVFVPQLNWRHGQPELAAEPQSLALVTTPGEVHTYEVVQTAPRLHTMTIRPDPESAEYGGQAAVVLEAPPEILPFESEIAETPRVTPVSPETPAPVLEPEPEPEVVPVSPETPAPAAEPEPEPVPQSPETPTPAAPSQEMPTEHAQDTGAPAAELKHTARTEHADPETSVAAQEPAPAPEADDSVTTTERSEPEKQVVAETMSAPQQPYESEQVGTITPEQAERVLDESSDNAHDTDVPVVTESASAQVAAKAASGAAGGADDLIRIDGIGPKISAALNAAGIDSFEKLANASPETLRTIITSAGVRLIGEVESWAQQAGYAARGDWAGLDTFNAERKRRS